MAFTVDFSGASEYEEMGGGGKMFAQDGLYKFQIIGVEEKTTASNNQGFKLTLLCVDPDEKGKKVTKTIPLTGKRTDGKPNIFQYQELMISVATTTEGLSTEEAKKKATSLEGKQLQSDSLKAAIENKFCYAQIEYRIWDTNDRETGEPVKIPVADAKRFETADRVAEAREAQSSQFRRPYSLTVQNAMNRNRSKSTPDSTGSSAPAESASDLI